MSSYVAPRPPAPPLISRSSLMPLRPRPVGGAQGDLPRRHEVAHDGVEDPGTRHEVVGDAARGDRDRHPPQVALQPAPAGQDRVAHGDGDRGVTAQRGRQRLEQRRDLVETRQLGGGRGQRLVVLAQRPRHHQRRLGRKRERQVLGRGTRVERGAGRRIGREEAQHLDGGPVHGEGADLDPGGHDHRAVLEDTAASGPGRRVPIGGEVRPDGAVAGPGRHLDADRSGAEREPHGLAQGIGGRVGPVRRRSRPRRAGAARPRRDGRAALPAREPTRS